MLRTSHINAAIQVTGKLDKMDYRVLPVVNTPLSSLNSDLPIAASIETNEFTPNPDFYVSCANLPTPGQDVSVYVANMESTARTLAGYVQSHLSFAKNVVKPLITEFVDSFTERANALTFSPADNLSIEKLDLPAPMLVTDLKDLIDDYAKLQPISADFVIFNAPDLSIVEIVDLMKTGNSAVDEAIAAWVATVGEAQVVQWYDRAFGTVKGGYPRLPLVSTQDACWNSTLAVFLMANKLHNNPPAGVTMSLVDYNVYVAKIRDMAGTTLAAIYDVYKGLLSTQTLIRTSFAGKMTVVAPVYEQWIADGNNDALLYSVLVGNKRYNFVNEVNEARLELMNAWELYTAMTVKTERSRKFVSMRKAFYDTAFALVEQNANSVYGHLKPEGSTQDHVQMQEYKVFKQKFEELHVNLREEDFVDIWKLAKRAVCDMLFYYTDAGQILDGIEDACKTNPDMEVDEAALLSTIAYVTRYVCNQMTLSKI